MENLSTCPAKWRGACIIRLLLDFWWYNANVVQLRHVCLSEGLRKHTEPRVLAEQVETGDIRVIMEVGPSHKPPQPASYETLKSP